MYDYSLLVQGVQLSQSSVMLTAIWISAALKYYLQSLCYVSYLNISDKFWIPAFVAIFSILT